MKKKETSKDNNFQIIQVALTLGYVIILPLVGLALLGRLIDRYFGTTPLFLLIAMFVAITLSSITLISKLKRYF